MRDLPMRDLPSGLDLLALARELLRDELAPLLPPERRRDAHLVATAMAIAAREAQAGEAWQHDICALLGALYADAAPHPGPLPASGGREAATAPEEGGDGASLLRRFAADLRNGAFETSPSQERAARAILWRLTIEKLGEGNPQFLAANGLRKAGGREM